LNKKDRNGNYVLLKAINKKNIEIIKLLIEYANENNIILDLNEKNKYRYYPILEAINKNNIEIIKLLILYANKNNIAFNIIDRWYSSLK